jgi:hypothetical protein
MSRHADLFKDIDSMEPEAFTRIWPTMSTSRSATVVTIYRGEGDLIDDYRIFMDVAPLFAGP